MWCNSNSYNGASAYAVAVEDPVVRSLPPLFLYLVPGFETGWPPR